MENVRYVMDNFPCVYFSGAEPAFRFIPMAIGQKPIFLSHKTSFRWSLFSGKKNQAFELWAFHFNLG
jgi:hypothetical protein